MYLVYIYVYNRVIFPNFLLYEKVEDERVLTNSFSITYPKALNLRDEISLRGKGCNIPDVTVTKIWIMASSALHNIFVKHTLMHQLKMSLIWLNVFRELKCVYLVY